MTREFHVLVVDDNQTIADTMARVLQRDGCRVDTVYSGTAALQRLENVDYQLVLTDLRMEPVDGLQVVQAARGRHHPPEVIVFTAYGSMEAAVEAMRLGARDFLTKPVTAQLLRNRVSELLHGVGTLESMEIIGASDFSKQFRRDLVAVARVRSTVLLRGEPGVGRSHVARWLHAHGLDASRGFHMLNLWDIPRWEELSEYGTILIRRADTLDEDRATTVLRVLDQQSIGAAPRVVATTSGRPGEEGWTGQAKMELYFRLAVIELDIPPLRARPADVGPLIEHFAHRFSEAFKRDASLPTLPQLQNLQRYLWPGNVREIANLVERAVVLGDHVYDLPLGPVPLHRPGPDRLPNLGDGFNLSEYLESM